MSKWLLQIFFVILVVTATIADSVASAKPIPISPVTLAYPEASNQAKGRESVSVGHGKVVKVAELPNN